MNKSLEYVFEYSLRRYAEFVYRGLKNPQNKNNIFVFCYVDIHNTKDEYSGKIIKMNKCKSLLNMACSNADNIKEFYIKLIPYLSLNNIICFIDKVKIGCASMLPQAACATNVTYDDVTNHNTVDNGFIISVIKFNLLEKNIIEFDNSQLYQYNISYNTVYRNAIIKFSNNYKVCTTPHNCADNMFVEIYCGQVLEKVDGTVTKINIKNALVESIIKDNYKNIEIISDMLNGDYNDNYKIIVRKYFIYGKNGIIFKVKNYLNQ